MDDFAKILEDAKFISSMMEGGEEVKGSPANANAPMFENMASIMNLMEIMKSFQSIGKPERKLQTPAPTDDDEGIPNNIKALRAMAPYMGSYNKKNVIVAAKLMELMHFVNSLDNGVQAASINDSGANNRNMLLAARPYVDKDKQDMVDLLITVMDISEIIRKIERMNNINGA